MGRQVVLVQGHPDLAGGHFCHALAQAYERGARAGGHGFSRIDVAALAFPLLRTKEDYEHGQAPPAIQAVQAQLAAADHLVFIYPLWMGDMPALLKGFLEQTFRPGFAFGPQQPDGNRAGGGLRGKSARVVVTMGMPGWVYRWFYRAHSLRSFKRNILAFAGVRPVRCSVLGMVEGQRAAVRDKRLAAIEALGRAAR
jgi:putative NADPH-quinone reductase